MATEKTMTKLVRPLRGGQITIPAEFRKQLGITEQTMLRLTLDKQGLRLTPVRVDDVSAGSPWLRELYQLYAPVRDEVATRNIPEEDVNADIDAAINAARRQRPADSR